MRNRKGVLKYFCKITLDITKNNSVIIVLINKFCIPYTITYAKHCSAEYASPMYVEISWGGMLKWYMLLSFLLGHSATREEVAYRWLSATLRHHRCFSNGETHSYVNLCDTKQCQEERVCLIGWLFHLMFELIYCSLSLFYNCDSRGDFVETALCQEKKARSVSGMPMSISYSAINTVNSSASILRPARSALNPYSFSSTGVVFHPYIKNSCDPYNSWRKQLYVFMQ